MTTEIQNNVSWLIPQIRNAEREQLKLKSDIAILEAEYKESEAYKNYLKLSRELQEAEAKELDLRNVAKNLMLENQLHDFTTLDWVTVQLNKTPWQLIIEKSAEQNIPEKYWKITKSIDKTSLKKAYTEWEFYDDWVYINTDFRLVIKND